MEWEKKVLGDRKLERGVNFLYFSSPPPPSKMREKLNTPMEHCLTPVLLVFFLDMFFGPTWFCIKPCSMVLHVLFPLQKNLVMFFQFLYGLMFSESTSPRCRTRARPLANIQALRKICFLFYLHKFHSHTLNCRGSHSNKSQALSGSWMGKPKKPDKMKPT